MEEAAGGRRRPLVVLTAPPLHGHMTPLLQLATALHAKGFTIAIAHTKLNPPDPSNHPDFIFLPLSDGLSAVDASSTFTDFIQTLNTNCRPSFHQHLSRLIAERNRQDRSIVVIYDHIMFFAGDVAIDLNLTPILFRSSSATFFTAFLARRQLNQQAQFHEDFVMQDMVPGLHPLRYKDLPFSKYPIEVWHQVLAIFSQESKTSAVILNTVKFLEHEAISQIHQHYQVPIFAVGPLHKITPSPPTSFVEEEDTNCITWLDKQAPKSVIYVSFGSLMTLDAKLLAEMAWGLAKSKQPFLWVVRPGSVCDLEWVEFLPEGFREETSGRSLIVKWAPQKKVLAHSAVGGFWSHCGWNSTLESISEGVPLICQPFNIDQGVHARYVSYVWKIGLESEVLERGEMESMIRRIMVDEEGKDMRARVGKMKEMVKDAVQNGGSSHDSLEDLVGFITSPL